MWKIHLDGAALHVPGTEVVIANGTLKQGRNSADSLTFDIPVTHPLYDACLNGVMTAKYVVSKDAEIVSKGRILSRTVNPFDGTAHVECEGELAYLNDGVISAYDFKGSPRDLIAQMLDEYNAQCDQGNEILLGNVTAYDPNDYIVRGSQKPVNCMTELIAKTANSSTGGWLVLRFEDKTYLDWLAEPNATGNQSIAKGANLLDISEELDGATLVTAIMPIGAPLSQDYVRLPASADGQLSGDVYRKGQFVYSKTLVDRYGWHAELQEWRDVTTPYNLRSRAISAVQTLAFDAELQISALDLSDAGYDVDHFRIGQRVAVTCDAIGGEMIVSGATWKMDNPASSSFTFGTEKSLTKKAAATAATADAAGWTGYNDISNYAWHDSGITDYGQLAEGTIVSALSRYDADETNTAQGVWHNAKNDIPIPSIGFMSGNEDAFGMVEAQTGISGCLIRHQGAWLDIHGGAIEFLMKRGLFDYWENGTYQSPADATDQIKFAWAIDPNIYELSLSQNGIVITRQGGYYPDYVIKLQNEGVVIGLEGQYPQRLKITNTGVDITGNVTVNGQPI